MKPGRYGVDRSGKSKNCAARIGTPKPVGGAYAAPLARAPAPLNGALRNAGSAVNASCPGTVPNTCGKNTMLPKAGVEFVPPALGTTAVIARASPVAEPDLGTLTMSQLAIR